MSVQDSAFHDRQRRMARLSVAESNRERLLGQMGGGGKAAATLLTSLSRPLAASQGGTTLLRVEGGR